MKVLVTGANGYLGRGIVDCLCRKQVEVISTDITCSKTSLNGVHFVKSNIFDVEHPFDFFGKPDILLHLAWKNGFVHNDSCHINELSQHFMFLKRMIDGGLTHLAVMGSMHEVGCYEGCIRDNTPTNPRTFYGIAKDALRRSTELLCSNAGVIFQWLRGFYIVGNSEDGCSVFSKIVQAENEGKKCFPFVTGENQCDFLDYDEFCEKTVSVVVQKKVNGVINICSGRPEKLRERAERFILDNGYSIQLDFGKFAQRTYDSQAIWGDASKIEKICRG